MAVNKHIEKALSSREFKFLLVGVINTAIGYGSYALFVFLKVNYLLANVFASVIGIINSYTWNRLFTFKSTGKKAPEFIRFVSVYIVSLILGMAVLYLLVGRFNMNKYLAGVLNLALVVAISWFGHNHFSFKEGKEQ